MSNNPSEMVVFDVNIDEIIPYVNNPRENEHAIDVVAASIDEFGWQQPIVLDRNNVIVAGDTRYRAALKLGKKTCPCKYADDLTPEQIKAYRIADNKTGEVSFWDRAKLEKEIKELAENGYDLTKTAFTDVELEGILNELSQVDIDSFFAPSAGAASESGSGDDHEGMIQCPHCGEWFTA